MLGIQFYVYSNKCEAARSWIALIETDRTVVVEYETVNNIG